MYSFIDQFLGIDSMGILEREIRHVQRLLERRYTAALSTNTYNPTVKTYNLRSHKDTLNPQKHHSPPPEINV